MLLQMTLRERRVPWCHVIVFMTKHHGTFGVDGVQGSSMTHDSTIWQMFLIVLLEEIIKLLKPATFGTSFLFLFFTSFSTSSSFSIFFFTLFRLVIIFFIKIVFQISLEVSVIIDFNLFDLTINTVS
uniref:Uncharacterized protein n=1 Tax=Cacopsylla melanoneura TaxID=428564 RepID=A0A8D9F131_9HEMI